MGVMKGDSWSLDYNSCGAERFQAVGELEFGHAHACLRIGHVWWTLIMEAYKNNVRM